MDQIADGDRPLSLQALQRDVAPIESIGGAVRFDLGKRHNYLFERGNSGNSKRSQPIRTLALDGVGSFSFAATAVEGELPPDCFLVAYLLDPDGMIIGHAKVPLTPPGRRATLDVPANADGICFAVRLTGAGIFEATTAALRFEQGDGAPVTRSFRFCVDPVLLAAGEQLPPLPIDDEYRRLKVLPADAVKRRLDHLGRQEDRTLLDRLLDRARATGEAPAVEAATIIQLARQFLAQNAARTADTLLEGVLADARLWPALGRAERKRLLLTLSHAATRCDRVDRALGLLKTAVLEEPGDWEYQFQLGLLLSVSNPSAGLVHLEEAQRLNPEMSVRRRIVLAEALMAAGLTDRADPLLHGGAADDRDRRDLELGLANLAGMLDRDTDRRLHIQQYFGSFGLSDEAFAQCQTGRPLGLPRPTGARRRDHPKVTVVMTSFNAAETLRWAAESVLDQTMANLELFIVDDLSTDDSRDVIAALAAADPRVRYRFNDRNVGTYVSKNHAIVSAEGAFVTFHDSDDWMHPQRVERHLSAMAGGAPMSYSRWIRADKALRVIPRRVGPYLHDNPASTFFRRETFDRLGYFDSVRSGADSEIFARTRRTYGWNAPKLIDEPLAVGLHHDRSLTQSGVAAFDMYRHSAVRLDYWEAWVAWHSAASARGNAADLRVPFPLTRRPFPAPADIAVAPDQPSSG